MVNPASPEVNVKNSARKNVAVQPQSAPAPDVDTRQTLTVGGWRLCVFSTDTSEPRIRDLDLAERLGYKKTHNIRDLIERLIAEGKLSGVQTFRTVRNVARQGRGEVKIEGLEFWLTEAQALKVIAKSGTDIADKILDEVIDVFRMAIRGLLSPGHAHAAEARLAMFLLTERQQVERFLSTNLIRAICQLYGYDHQAGERPPQFFRMVAERIYAAVFGTEVHTEMRHRGDQRQYYQYLTESGHQLAKHDLSKLEALARTSFDPDEFWMRVAAEYRGGGVQGKLFS